MSEIKFWVWDRTLGRWLNPDEVRIGTSGEIEVKTTGSLIDFVRSVELKPLNTLEGERIAVTNHNR